MGWKFVIFFEFQIIWPQSWILANRSVINCWKWIDFPTRTHLHSHTAAVLLNCCLYHYNEQITFSCTVPSSFNSSVREQFHFHHISPRLLEKKPIIITPHQSSSPKRRELDHFAHPSSNVTFLALLFFISTHNHHPWSSSWCFHHLNSARAHHQHKVRKSFLVWCNRWELSLSLVTTKFGALPYIFSSIALFLMNYADAAHKRAKVTSSSLKTDCTSDGAREP